MHQHYITMFLAEADDKLDVGFSLPLQKIALARGNEHEQRDFMLSDEVQNLLEDAATAQFSHSLSAERMAATVKKREGRHIALLGNVSRDLLCRKFNIWRENKCQLLEHAAKGLWKAKKTRLERDCMAAGLQQCTSWPPMDARNSSQTPGHHCHRQH